MRRRLSFTFVAAALAGATALPAAAQLEPPVSVAFNIRAIPAWSNSTFQSNIFTVFNEGSIVSRSQIGNGIIPATGQGDRLMWHGAKAAFRAGGAGQSGTTAWDEGYIGYYSIAGGYATVAAAAYTTAFGYLSTVTNQAPYGTALGYQAYVSHTAGFASGYQTSCNGAYCKAMGYRSNASGQGAVAIGYRATADSDYGLALGHRASTNGHDGAMVFGDNSTTDSVEATANNQFMVRAAGGYRLYTNATLTAGVFVNGGSGSWSTISDRHRKENFQDVEGESLLARLRTIPVSSWRYIAEEDRTVRHIGPMAQDWHRAFGLSADTTTINTGDIDGVNLAAAQALLHRTDALATDAAVLGASHDALAATLARTRADLDAARADLVATRRDLADARARLDALGTVAADVARLRAALDALLARTPAPAPAP